ncbi:RcnB family protein [Sphingomonas sp. ASV193]|uniref:RcnB family protein n=1 Tax=Sphingomonas sp. ASV193 TaxID=3144405 RepID=UPI0032E8FA86
MRKFILFAAMAASAVPGTAMSQDMRHDRQEVRHDRREIRQDRRELRHDRRDLREDRRDHRRVAYVAPYRGWAYRPVTVGYQLRPAFYGSRYHVSDYGRFNVRAPARWQRWVRYGDDLLLVNVRTGRVLQVVHYRYW